MERAVSLEEISDGRLYDLEDMVKADCQDCKGCNECCKGMGSSIILDPYDIYRLEQGLGRSFESLISAELELGVVDGIILPHLRMVGDEEKCAFNNEDGRCSIHGIRPGFCRLFPLGRIYEDHSFKYFLQIHECKKTNRSKIKVKKWIDTPNVKEYERFVTDWHYFQKELQAQMAAGDDNYGRNMNLYVLNMFFVRSYDVRQDFYEQFSRRMDEAMDALGIEMERVLQ